MKEYKKGDIINIKNNKKFQEINDEFSGIQMTLNHFATMYGIVTQALWDLIKKEYPELHKKYSLSYNNYKIKIIAKKER